MRIQMRMPEGAKLQLRPSFCIGGDGWLRHEIWEGDTDEFPMIYG